MIRLDKACDLSAFTDSESSRYALSAVRFRPPCKKAVADEYRKLRQPKEKTRTVGKPARHGIRKRHVKEFVCMSIMPASEAYELAVSRVRGTVEATDGRRLVVVPCLNGQDFPQTSGASKEPKECLIPSDYLKQALQRIPRKVFREVLASARLTQPDDNNVILSTTNGERSTDETVRQIDGRFPRTDDVWPTAPPEMTVSLDCALLEGILKHARTFTDKDNRGIDVILRGSDAAVEFQYQLSEGRTAKALLMPLVRDRVKKQA